jgi:hypothetical protein
VFAPRTNFPPHAQLTWRCHDCTRHDPDAPGDLPDLPYLPVADVLDDALLGKWLDAPARRDLLEFALTALLALPADGRVFLAAPADDVAKVVYAVTRVLPPGLLDDFSFSTYEPHPFACPARLVGFESGSDARDLPDACYAPPHAAFNPATGRKTDVATKVPFAAFAVQALADGEVAKLDEVKATWQRLGLKDPRHFDLVYRMARGTGVLEKDEAAEALQLPAVASWIAARADALNQFLDWALDDRAFATASFSRAVQALRQKPDLVAKLAATVREAGLKALKAGDVDRTATALEVVLPMAAPAKAAGVWGDLLTQLTDPDGLPWPVRWYLLPRFARFKHQQQPGAGADPAVTKWLAVPADRFGELLGLDLPRAYQLAAGRAVLARPGEPSADLARTLGKHPKLALALLRPAGDAADEADRTAKLYESLLAEAPEHPWFEELLAAADTYPADVLNRYFEASLAAGRLDADRVVRTQGPKLLGLFAGKSGLDKVGRQFLANPPADLLHHTGVLDFLTSLYPQANLSAELTTRIAAVRAARAFLDAPTFTPEAMDPAAAALGVHPPVLPPAAKAEVFDAVARELVKRAGDESLQDDLEAALVHFGDALATGPADLYENLLRDLRGKTDFGRGANLVHAFLAVALGAAKSPDLAGKLDDLDGQAFAVASDAARRGGRRVLAEIDRRAGEWPKDARTKWAFLHTAVRPQGAKRLLRDAVVFAAGAAAATAAWWAVRLLG